MVNDNGVLFTIFGGTGHLTYNKLMPAFYQLFLEERLDSIAIVAIGRRDKDNSKYRDEIIATIKKKSKTYDQVAIELFAKKLYYYKMDFNQGEAYKELGIYLDSLDQQVAAGGNRIFYLATAPNDFPTISELLKRNGLLNSSGYIRAAFEKPFGYDLTSAKAINQRIADVFGEDHIYRIDHYLGKEMIQNIFMIRFTNEIFKAVWNHQSIDNIQITVQESVGVEERGGYYDQSGALRDMLQNHLLQILALIGMEPPQVLNTQTIRDEKVKVLKSVRLMPEKDGQSNIVLGQYQGYTSESKVNPESTTETFVALKCSIDTLRWKGVPIYLKTGKKLRSREASIIIEFKNDVCCPAFEASAKPNLLIIKIQPEEGVYFRINTKKPRSENVLMPVSMDYCQSCNIYYRSPEAYERLLYDIIQGDSTLFTRWDEVESSWIMIDYLLSSSNYEKNSVVLYEENTNGPIEADNLLIKEGRHWWYLEDIESRWDTPNGFGEVDKT